MELVEAQDYILGVLGSSPSGDITSLNPDAQAARQALTRISKSIQKRGWWFNTDHNVTMEPALVSREILLPSNVLKIIPIGNQLIVQRGIKLYNSETNSYQFDSAVVADRIVNLEWDLLPLDVQDAIRFKASSELCTTELEDETKADAEKELYQAAYFEIKRSDLKASKKNALNSPHAQKMLGGVRPYRSRR